ncbi:MAG: DNA-binding protein H-NS [Paracoccaceae bacterium]|jgi:DNA-binding protein H-NS
MTFDLKGMSLKELSKLQDEVAKALEGANDHERSLALKAAENAAAKFGYSLDELSGTGKPKAGKKRAKAAAKYKNPADPEQTWSGRGRRPQWIHDSLSAGADITDLEI